MRAWWALAACTMAIVLAAGTRTSYAAFLQSIEQDLHVDRTTLSAASALMLVVYGLCQPLVGALATRYEPRFVMIGGALLLAAGGFGLASATEPWQLFLYGGLVPGFSFGAATGLPATVLMARWFGRRLGLATGIVNSAVPAGPGMIIPLATALIPLLGWRETYVVLGLVLALPTVPALWLLATTPPSDARRAAVATRRRPPAGLDIWLLGAGYFGCGFTDQFITLHLLALAIDAGLSSVFAATTLSVLMFAGIAGSIISGSLADRFKAKRILASGYFLRGISLPLLLLIIHGGPAWVLVLFAPLFGVTFVANQAPGARLVRDRYGVGAVGALMGRVGLAHQFGGAIGMLLGGLSVSVLGSYQLAVVVATGVVLTGALLQLFIGEPRGSVPVARARVAPA
ncbi:MAG: MFS transporter [Chloroflexi bacterium]|nr:MFS transporter [Chloroflexota bacterium]